MKRLCRSLAFSLFLALVAGISLAQAPLVPIAGSPFTWSRGGHNSNVAIFSLDGFALFVTNQDSREITVLTLNDSGVPSFAGKYPTTPAKQPAGMAVNPAGDKLYVTTGGSTVNVHTINPDYSLQQVQAANILPATSTAYNGIAYFSTEGGDFVYVHNDLATSNSITIFPVQADGTLGAPRTPATSTGGNGSGGPLFYEAPSMVISPDGRLFVVNSAAASNSIGAFVLNNDGTLTATGAAVKLPTGVVSSGALAFGTAGDFMFLVAGGTKGELVTFAIAPDTNVISVIGTFKTGNPAEPVDGLAVHPSGGAMVACFPASRKIAVMATDTGLQLPGSPIAADGVCPVGALFNAAGTLFYNPNCSYTTSLSVYTVNF